MFNGNCRTIDEIIVLQKEVMCRADSVDHCKPLFLTLKCQTGINTL